MLLVNRFAPSCVCRRSDNRDSNTTPTEIHDLHMSNRSSPHGNNISTSSGTVHGIRYTRMNRLDNKSSYLLQYISNKVTSLVHKNRVIGDQDEDEDEDEHVPYLLMIRALTTLTFRPECIVHTLMHIHFVEFGDVDLGFLHLTIATQRCDAAERMCI